MKHKINFLIFILAVILFFYYHFYFAKRAENNIELPIAVSYQDIKKNAEIILPLNNTSTTEELITDSDATEDEVVTPIKERGNINLAVPFTSQAPTANWDQPFQDACEEASLLMVDYYYGDKKLPAKLEVENILKQMVSWQEQNWGAHKNLSAVKVADLGLAMFNQRLEVVEDLTVDKIKRYLQAGRPIIIPADGKKLDNPNFRNGGPVYHMLVIKGYMDDKFITNDPGTRLGADFVYTQDNIIKSIGDWDENKNAASGGKVGLVFMLK